MRDFTKQENQHIASLLQDSRFNSLVNWLTEALEEANRRIYYSATDREQHFAIGGAIAIDAILSEIRKAPEKLEDENRAPILGGTLY